MRSKPKQPQKLRPVPADQRPRILEVFDDRRVRLTKAKS